MLVENNVISKLSRCVDRIVTMESKKEIKDDHSFALKVDIFRTYIQHM